MSERIVVGLRPWLPWPLSQVPWWTEPIRAERLAAFRIGVAAVLLVDVLWTYLPHTDIYFGPGSLGSPEVFASHMRAPAWNWTLLANLTAAQIHLVLWGWVSAAVLLLLGILPRLSATVCWALALSVLNSNYYIHNAGDRLRSICLFMVMVAPCAAVWSMSAGRITRRAGQAPGGAGAVFVYPWPARLLFLQMTVVYYMSGLLKLDGSDWLRGETLYVLLGDISWTRYPFHTLPLPMILLRLSTWLVLFWEVTFPLLVLMPRLRPLALWFGVAFHIATGLTIEIGTFPLYALCFYLPLVPWERYIDRWRGARPPALAKGPEAIGVEMANES
jgi:uncharacterized membrane protein YphA (DoxX/SURF4 family)